MLEEVWDKITDEFDYFIHFEWISDSLEFFSGIFENLSEFSVIGIIYGIVMVALVFVFRSSVFSWVNAMPLATKVIMIPIFYIFAFICGYIIGKRLWE